jgi:hypothetical protein
MSRPRREYKNKAIVQLRKLGWSNYAVAKAFNDYKANTKKIFERDKDRYNLPVAIPFNFKPPEQGVGVR